MAQQTLSSSSIITTAVVLAGIVRYSGGALESSGEQNAEDVSKDLCLYKERVQGESTRRWQWGT